MDLPLVIPDDDQRVGIQREREIVARLGNLAAVAGKQPSPPPDLLDIGTVDQFVPVEFARQTMPRLAGLDQPFEIFQFTPFFFNLGFSAAKMDRWLRQAIVPVVAAAVKKDRRLMVV